MNELSGKTFMEGEYSRFRATVFRQRRNRHVRGARSGRLDVSSVDLDHCSTISSVSSEGENKGRRSFSR